MPEQVISTPWGNLAVPEGAPQGLTDFAGLARQAQAAASGESGAKAAALAQASQVALSAASIPVAGWVVSLGGVVIGAILSAFGIRGRTQHMTTQQASETATKWINQQIKSVWDTLPDDGKQELFRRVAVWINNAWGIYKNNWDGVIGREGAQYFPYPESRVQGGVESVVNGNVGTAWTEIYNISYFFLFRILSFSDAENLESEVWGPWNWRYNNDVLVPLNAYMLDKYNKSIEQYRAAGGDQVNKETPSGVSKSGVGVLVGVGVAGAFLYVLHSLFKKG